MRYERADLASFELTSGMVDLVVSSLALHYVGDLDDLIARVSRWLVPGGQFIFSIEHPVITAPREPAGAVLTDYADERPRQRTWFVDGVVKYHRTLGSILAMARRHGFELLAVDEPLPTAAQIQAHPHLASHRHRPPLLLVSARR